MIDFPRLQDFRDHPLLLLVLLAANWPVYRYFVRVLFGGREGFAEAIGYWFIPDLYSYLTNRFVEDIWAEARLSALFVVCALCVCVEYVLLTSLLDWWYANVICCAPGKA